MRAGRDSGWLSDEGGKVVALNLGADFVSEHEWGIGDLRRRLGVDGVLPKFSKEKAVYKKPPGIGRRTISLNNSVKLYERPGEALLLCKPDYGHEAFSQAIQKDGVERTWDAYLPHDLRRAGDLLCAWDEGSFGILAKKGNVEKLREIHQAFLNLDVALWVGRSKLFDNGGLILCIVSRTPADCLETMRVADEDAEKLKAASAATGIIGRLKAAGREYFACAPKWIDGFRPAGQTPKSAHPVIYFLNPEQQQENNSGWYTVEELDLWIKGEGPIPKSPKGSVAVHLKDLEDVPPDARMRKQQEGRSKRS